MSDDDGRTENSEDDALQRLRSRLLGSQAIQKPLGWAGIYLSDRLQNVVAPCFTIEYGPFGSGKEPSYRVIQTALTI